MNAGLQYIPASPSSRCTGGPSTGQRLSAQNSPSTRSKRPNRGTTSVHSTCGWTSSCRRAGQRPLNPPTRPEHAPKRPPLGASGRPPPPNRDRGRISGHASHTPRARSPPPQLPTFCGAHPPNGVPGPPVPVPGRSSTKKEKSVSRFPKNAHGHIMCWRWAVGGWSPLAVGGWWELAVGGWWSLGAVPKGGP